jgi:hypothetical protein
MHRTITHQPHSAAPRAWAAVKLQARAASRQRKPYTKPTVTPGDEEAQISALCARNPYM